MRSANLVLILLVLFILGCAPTVIEGGKIDSAKVKQLVIQSTKVDKVVEMFGKPQQIEQLSSVEEKYVYRYLTKDPSWYTMDKTNKQILEIIFKDGVVQNYKFRSEAMEMVYQE